MTIGSGLGGIKMTKKVNWSDAPKDADGVFFDTFIKFDSCLLYTSPSPRDKRQSRMPSSA